MADTTAPIPTWSLLHDWAGDEGSRDPILAIVTAPDPDTARQIAEATYTTDIDGQPTRAFGELTYGVAVFRGDISATAVGGIEIVHLNPDPATPPGPARCGCAPDCPFCGAAIDIPHQPQCLWEPRTLPHQPHPAAPIVSAEHTHRPGCPHTRRHPGPLFIPAELCTFCGAINTSDRDRFPSFGGTTEGHERCTACGQQWGWADLTAIH
jgi:hypothetical protein